MLIVFAIVVPVLLALVAVAAMRPATFRIERARSIAATPEKIYALISDFHRWTAWSPWEGLDPALKRTYSGAAVGRGSVYAWEGNSKVGKGRMEITAATAPDKVTIKLDFLKPFEAHNTAEFAIQPEGGSTNVTWVMYGPRPFMIRLMTIFFNMDNLIGRDFEKGLANLKIAAES